jgi:hypothetical protein
MFVSGQRFGSEWGDTGDTTDTNFTLWTASTNCWPVVLAVHKFTGGPSVLRQTEALDINKSLPHWAFSWSSFLKLYNCWWKRQTDIITITLTHWMKDGPYHMTSLFRKCVYVWQLFADGAQSDWHTERLLVDTEMVLHIKTVLAIINSIVLTILGNFPRWPYIQSVYWCCRYDGPEYSICRAAIAVSVHRLYIQPPEKIP